MKKLVIAGGYGGTVFGERNAVMIGSDIITGGDVLVAGIMPR